MDSAARNDSDLITSPAVDTSGNKETRADPTRMIEMFKRMVLIRAFEDQCMVLYRAGRIRGVTHTSQGQEAVAVGACATLRADDYITSTHRGHGHVIAKGGDVKLMMAELMGRSTGYCRGHGGSMHIADMDQGILGANGIVGGGIGIATGAALSSLLLGRDNVAICFFGDGAANQGILHEASNLAAIWKLPAVFLCENNHYAQSSRPENFLSVGDLAVRAQGYGIPGYSCNGMDVLDVYHSTMRAVSRARRGEGPSYVICEAYRLMGHHVGDPLNYRDETEVLRWKERDPIRAFSARLLGEGIALQDELDLWVTEAKMAVTEAVAFAEASPEPEAGELMENIFA